jgi:hypothetical protein
LSYEMAFDKNNLVLGPYIGILAVNREERLRQIVNRLKSYLISYEEIGGAVLVFSEDGVEEDKRLIRGFMFNPENRSWVEGTYPYPAAIFKRTRIEKNLRNHLQSLLGDRIFNNYVFNKWEAYEWLSCFDAVKQYLPDTVIYSQPESVGEFLKQHKSVFIKPIDGSRGKGILKLDSQVDEFILYFSEMGENKEMRFKTLDELNEFLKNNLEERKYIIQRTLELISTGQSKIDFRLILIKDRDGQWKDVGMIARQGVKGSITSNVSTGGMAESAEKTFKDVLQLSDDQAFYLRNKMSLIGRQAAFWMEECGVGCGNLGIDMAIDVQGQIWIIEVNNINPDHTIAIDANDRDMFYRARLLNMLYAKRLAGFPK